MAVNRLNLLFCVTLYNDTQVTTRKHAHSNPQTEMLATIWFGIYRRVLKSNRKKSGAIHSVHDNQYDLLCSTLAVLID